MTQIVAIIVILIFLVAREFFSFFADAAPTILQLIHLYLYWVVAVTVYSGVRFTTVNWKDLR